jgi:dihydroorotate dehydrogenase
VSWYSLARPVLFALDPETAHDLTMLALRMPGVAALLARHHPRSTAHHPTAHYPPPTIHHPALRQQLLGLPFDNPLGLAAGLDKQGSAVNAWRALGFGHAEIGTVTPLPQPGNPKPRLYRLPDDRALINRFGFNSEGAAAVAAHLAGGWLILAAG